MPNHLDSIPPGLNYQKRDLSASNEKRHEERSHVITLCEIITTDQELPFIICAFYLRVPFSGGYTVSCMEHGHTADFMIHVRGDTTLTIGSYGSAGTCIINCVVPYSCARHLVPYVAAVKNPYPVTSLYVMMT